MKNIFEKDLYRYYGDKKRTLKSKIFTPIQIKYIKTYRKCRSAKNKLSKMYYVFKLQSLQKKSSIQIPYKAEIGEGFYIGHFGSIVINPKAKLGKNVNIASGVTIGQENRGKREGVPTIGNEVWIGTNAVIVGNITIGDDVLIAPLSFVNFDVPSHSIVIGNPAKIIHRENATDGYINNKV